MWAKVRWWERKADFKTWWEWGWIKHPTVQMFWSIKMVVTILAVNKRIAWWQLPSWNFTAWSWFKDTFMMKKSLLNVFSPFKKKQWGAHQIQSETFILILFDLLPRTSSLDKVHYVSLNHSFGFLLLNFPLYVLNRFWMLFYWADINKVKTCKLYSYVLTYVPTHETVTPINIKNIPLLLASLYTFPLLHPYFLNPAFVCVCV